jgi:hypothetical protein
MKEEGLVKILGRIQDPLYFIMLIEESRSSGLNGLLIQADNDVSIILKVLDDNIEVMKIIVYNKDILKELGDYIRIESLIFLEDSNFYIYKPISDEEMLLTKLVEYIIMKKVNIYASVVNYYMFEEIGRKES